jgi:hypothetical protein
MRSFIICTLPQILLARSNQVENEVGRTWGANGRREKIILAVKHSPHLVPSS